MSMGIQVPTTEIGEILEDSPAALAGLQSGDKILMLAGKPISEWDDIKGSVQSSQGKEIRALVERNGKEIETSIVPQLMTDKDLLGDEFSEWRIGISPGSFETQSVNPLEAFILGVERTYFYTELTLKVLGRLLQFRMSLDALGGPIMIAQVSGQQASQGLLSFIGFIGVLSLSLGVFNLLPIPPLDGGHIAFFLVEAIKGSPVSLKSREVVTQIGVFLIVSLLIFVSYNDIMRFFTE